MELDRIDKILDRIATPYKVDKNTWGWLPIIDAQKKLALQAIEAYIAEQNAEAFIKWGWGERCESTDKEDFPDTDYEDPNNARCANCEMWEHYDEWLDHLSKKGDIESDIEHQPVDIEKRDLTKTRSTGEFEEKLEPRIEKDFCEAILDGDAVNDFQQIKAWRVIEWVEKYISELLNQATQDAYKKGYVDGGLDEILRDKKAKNKLMKYLDND